MRKPNVAFVCVHNSCRSQMAEAISKHIAADVFEAYSGGTQTKPKINQDAVDIIKELYNINMEETQQSKLLDALPKADIVIKMGCEVACPLFEGKYEEDWGIDDPTGKSHEKFLKTAKTIETKVIELKNKIEHNHYPVL